MFERYYRELLNFLARKVSDRDTAADLTQESFARIYAAQQAGQAVREPRAWLYATARNLLTDHHRRAAVRETGAADGDGDRGDADAHVGPPSLEPDAILSGRQRLAAIEQALLQLSPRPREAFVLFKLEGLSRSEVAQKMGVNVKTVETHLEVAMDACMRQLQALEGEVVPPAGGRRRRRTGSAPP
ncbi:RNA polymerase subunit sigma [Acidovorax sp. Leaf76]|uniref:RNA polymerase sigma factor n=1 Tax=unclassified Acidovorax TaxID=2684926 RepID=UPI0006FEA8DF|nr:MULTISPECIES: RNA polymerase sigma factor [unclassified Acidovorax]KQO24161.1 RNA polymerase subunit sigma [Acidovorax sp. Leaf76]KQO37085.1 RNA polymerase subunit sigma [Acidovorax sp. Leaf84]KQS29241.1 RNA polymerase subunit sigma [Acidovorax sp. Leaf191]